ncbi:MAG: YjbQ family protein [Calditrichaceae bacterium]|nr:YjbQ family protein [Calditrichaceae bacterium]MBN2707749.1 YjbQ family protein [Calditrichaceae bacterium]RQV96384.1 MAG: YjbQ family protein [Calditrichota bacterium]
MEQFSVKTSARTQMIDITTEIRKIVKEKGIKNGILTVFIPHTTAAVTINENADPDVQRDITYEIDKIVPFNDGYHHMEGNSAAHIKASLFGSSELVIISEGSLQLGTWQGIYFCEFDGPRHRKVWVKINEC